MKFQSNNNVMSTTDVDKLKEEYEALVDQVSALQVDFNTLNSIIDGYDQSIETGELSASNVNVSGEIDASVIKSSTKSTFNKIFYSTLFRGEPSVVQPYSINTNEYALFRTKEPANPCFEAVIQLDNPSDKPFMIKDYHNVLMLIGAPEGYKLKRAQYNGYCYYFLVTAAAVATNTVRAWVNGAIAEATTDMTAYGSSTTSVEATSIDQVAISGSVNVSNTSLSFENATISTLNSTSATIASLASTAINADNLTAININSKGITNNGNISNSGEISSKTATITDTATIDKVVTNGITNNGDIVSQGNTMTYGTDIAEKALFGSLSTSSIAFNEYAFIDIATPNSNTEYNLIELPNFIGEYNLVFKDSSNKIIFAAKFSNANSELPSTTFQYSTTSLTAFANVQYADDKIYIKTYNGGKLYYQSSTVEAANAPETYSSINLPTLTDIAYSIDITQLTSTVFFTKGITIKGKVTADIIDNPTTGSYENLDVSKALSIGTTLGVSNGNGNYGQILDVNSDGNPQWSMPTGYTYVIKNKEQFVKWATESHTTSDKYTAVLIDLDSAASIEDITTTDNYLVNCTNTKIVAMTNSSAALAFTGTTLETTFHCNSTVKFINVNVFSDTHKYCINGAGLVDRCSITMNASTSDTFGLEKCVLVTDCNITSNATLSHSAYGIDACSAVVNTSAIARGAYGYGYSYCGSITNCIDYGSTTKGFIGCTSVLNATGTTTQCSTLIGNSSLIASLYGDVTNPNAKGTLPIGANYLSADGVSPATIFGGEWTFVTAF